MSYTYIGSLKARFKAAHSLALARSEEVSIPYTSGGGLTAEEWAKKTLSNVILDFPEIQSRTNYRKLLGTSTFMHSTPSRHRTTDDYDPDGLMRKWHWVLELHGVGFDFTGEGVKSVVGEAPRQNSDQSVAIGYTIEARARHVVRDSLLNHDGTVARTGKNSPFFEATYTVDELRNAIVTDNESLVLNSLKVAFEAKELDDLAAKLVGDAFSEKGYVPFETKPDTDSQPYIFHGASGGPFASAAYVINFQHPPAVETPIELPLYYDSSNSRYLVSLRLLDDEATSLVATINDEAKTLQQAAAKRALGQEATVPSESSVNPDDYQVGVNKQQAADWQIAYRIEAEKINKTPVKDIVTPYLESTSMTPEQIQTEKDKLLAGSKPGESGWSSAWDTLKRAGSSVGDYMSKWSPADYIGAYAGYKATKAITKNPWLTLIAVLGVAYIVLK